MMISDLKLNQFQREVCTVHTMAQDTFRIGERVLCYEMVHHGPWEGQQALSRRCESGYTLNNVGSEDDHRLISSTGALLWVGSSLGQVTPSCGERNW